MLTRSFLCASAVCFILIAVPSVVPARDEEMVESWAATLGEELWELGTTVTKSPEIRTSYTKLNARVLPTDGEGILKNILSNVGRLVKQKLDAVRCLIKKAEESHEKSSEDLTSYENQTYINSVYSTTIDESGSMENYSRDDELEIETEFFDAVELRRDNQFYGIPVNTDASSVHVPLDVFDRGAKVLPGIAWSQSLDSIFINNYLSDSQISWQYFCSSEGFLRHFPASRWYEDDSLFDCRYRDWFMEAASGPKDVVMMIDYSGSMNDIRKTIANITYQTILDTLTNNDYVNIFTFNKTIRGVTPCFNQTLVHATPENVQVLKSGLTNIKAPDDKADLEKAFLHALQFIENKRESRTGDEEESTPIIMLITDGVFENMTDFFNEHNSFNNRTRIPVRIFVFVVGKDASGVEFAQMIACQNRGYFAHVKSYQEIREKVLNYVKLLALPVSLPDTNRPLMWSHLFLDASAAAESESVESRIMTSVSGPVFSMERDEQTPREETLLGVAGTDIPINDLKKLALPYKIGANGYAFLLTNNGHLMFHPDLRSVEDGVLKVNFNSVDLTEVELYDDDVPDVRAFNDEVLKLREAMVLQKEGTMTNMKMKFHYDGMRRVGTETRSYFYAPVNNTPFTLGLVLPYSYGSYWIKAGDEIKKSVQMGIPLTNHFQGNWRVHPDWIYCDYHKTSLWFGSKEEKITHFLERMFSSDWKWKDQFPDKDYTDLSAPEDCDKEPIENEDYFCDKDLMQLLVFDAKVTENSYKDSHWSAKNRREEEIVQQFGVSMRFVSTQSGLTRWQNIPDLPDGALPFGDNYHRSLEESWYKSAVLFHQIDPDAFVFSVPVYAGLVSDSVVTSTFAIFPRDGGNEAPGSVVGFQMEHKSLFDRFKDITSKTKCKECNLTCVSDSLDCYIIDSNGFIIVSEELNDTGRFFGDFEGAVMEAMISKNIFRKIPMFDYQGICFKTVLIRSAADILKTPFILVSQLLSWLASRIIFMLIHMDQWIPAFGAAIKDDYDYGYVDSKKEDRVYVEPSGPKEPVYERIAESCDKAGYLYSMQPESKEQEYTSTGVNCSRPFYAKRIPKTNLMLVVVNTLYQSCYVNMTAHIDRVEYNLNIDFSHSACDKLPLNNLTRSRPTPCFALTPPDEDVKCGSEKLNPELFLIFLVIFIKYNFFTFNE